MTKSLFLKEVVPWTVERDGLYSVTLGSMMKVLPGGGGVGGEPGSLDGKVRLLSLGQP